MGFQNFRYVKKSKTCSLYYRSNMVGMLFDDIHEVFCWTATLFGRID